VGTCGYSRICLALRSDGISSIKIFSLRRWLEEEGAGRGVVDGTGGVVWGSARVLCEHLTAHPEVRPAFSGLGV